jgi:membrane-bound serine protease (ClpP class)
VFVLRKAVQTRRLPKPTDATNLIGMVGDVKRAISDDVVGSVYVDGELWQATSDDTLDIGQPAEVVGVDGLTVRVRPATETTTSDAGVAG